MPRNITPLLKKNFLVLLILVFPALTVASEQDVIIGFHGPAGSLERELITARGGTVRRELNLIHALAAKIPDAALPGLRAHPNVKYIEQDARLYTPVPQPLPAPEILAASVSEYQQNWSVQHIASGTARSQGITGAGVKIAVIDTGIDYNHPELKDNYQGGYDFVNGDDDPMDDSYPSHGTIVAGIIAAKQNDQGIVGVAPDASLYALKVMDSEGFSSISNVIAALQWTVEHNIDIANISMGGPNSPAFREACDAAYEAGVLIVAAAGNTSRQGVDYPAAYSSVIAVGATDRQDQPEPYTAKGNEVELAAPGASIYSTIRDGRFGTVSGTSQAAPHIAGVAALILSAGVNDLNNDGLADNRDIRLKLLGASRDQGEPGRDELYGYGIIDVNGIFNPRPVQLPDLAISLRDNRDPVFRGDWFNYVLTVQNNGAADTRDAKLMLTFPFDMVTKGNHCTPVNSEPETGNSGSDNKSNDTVMECELGWIAKNGGTRTLDIAVKMVQSGNTNKAVSKALVSAPLEADTADNSAEESTAITSRPPAAGSVTIDVVMNTSRTTDNVLFAARNLDRDTMYIDSADLVSEEGGTVVNHGNGIFTYTPPEGFTGNDSFNYVIRDGHGRVVTGTVKITVKIALTIDIEDSADPVIPGENVVYTITVTNDSALKVHALELLIGFQVRSEMEFLSVDKNCQKKTPGASENVSCLIDKIDENGGIVQFQLTAKALAVTTANLYVILIDKGNIQAGLSIEETTVTKPNNNPVAEADHDSTDENTPLTITTLLDNDTDADGDQLHITEVDETSQQGGGVVLGKNSSISYTPPADFSGEDSFQYTISDGNGGAAIGTVTITVNKTIIPEPLSPSESVPSKPKAGALGFLMFLMFFIHMLNKRSEKVTS